LNGSIVGQTVNGQFFVILISVVSAAAGRFDPIHAQAGAPSNIILRFERSGCFGPCPAYVVEVDSLGVARYEGFRFVLTAGKAFVQLTPATMMDLEDVLRRIRALPSPRVKDCSDYWTDQIEVRLTLSGQFARRKISDYHGCRGMKNRIQNDRLRELRRLEDRLDEILGSERWVGTLAQRKECCYGRFFKK
jgi:hypothetical protein